MGACLMGVYLMGVYLMGVYFMGVYLMGVYLMGVYLMGVHLIGLHFLNHMYKQSMTGCCTSWLVRQQCPGLSTYPGSVTPHFTALKAASASSDGL
jgi:uncharacterized protein YjbI with pentapeptide repeats